MIKISRAPALYVTPSRQYGPGTALTCGHPQYCHLQPSRLHRLNPGTAIVGIPPRAPRVLSSSPAARLRPERAQFAANSSTRFGIVWRTATVGSKYYQRAPSELASLVSVFHLKAELGPPTVPFAELAQIRRCSRYLH